MTNEEKKEIDDRFKGYKKHLRNVDVMEKDKHKINVLVPLLGHAFNETHRIALLLKILEDIESERSKTIRDIENKLTRIMKHLDIK